MEYIEPGTVPYFSDCEPLVAGLGYSLVELVVFKRQSTWNVRIVITGPNGVGIADCSKVHRAILPRLEAILDSQDMFVEVASPGMDRIMKNASEFRIFAGKQVKVWNTDISDWIAGTVVSSDSESVRLAVNGAETDIPYNKIAKAKLFSQG